jgi:hypothetical protein
MNKILTTFAVVLFVVLLIAAVVGFVAGMIWLEGWILLWLHTMIHPASVFANGNVWVYGILALVLSGIFGGRTVVKTVTVQVEKQQARRR